MKKSIIIVCAALGFNAAVAQINNPGTNSYKGSSTPTQTVTPGTSDSSRYRSGSSARKRKPSWKDNTMDTASTSSKNSFTPRAKGATKSSGNSDTTGTPYHK